MRSALEGAYKQEGEKERTRKRNKKKERDESMDRKGKLEKESQVFDKVCPLVFCTPPYSHLPVLPLRVQHLIVVSSTLLQILPLLGIISRSIGPWLVSGSAFGSQGMPSTLWR